MGRFLPLLLFYLAFMALPPCLGRGDLSFEIQSGGLWKKSVKTISFLEMEAYTKKEGDRTYLFPNPHATLGNCALDSITLLTGEGDTRTHADALYINIYNKETTDQPLPLETFKSMVDSLKATLDEDLAAPGKLGAEKNSYLWETLNGAAFLSFETTKGAGGKIEPQIMTLVLSKKGGLAAALRDRDKATLKASATPENPSTTEDAASGSKTKLTKAQLKASVIESAGNIYIKNIPQPERSPTYKDEELAINTLVAMLKYYGVQNIDDAALKKQLSDMANSRNNSSKEALPELISKIVRQELHGKVTYLEKLQEGRETTQIIKKCDKEAKTPYNRGALDYYYRTLFSFPKHILVKNRAGNAANNEKWFKDIREQIDQGHPLMWWYYNKRETFRIIIGYNIDRQQILYMDSEKQFEMLPLDEAISYSIWITAITP